jgi:hypothetical protein
MKQAIRAVGWAINILWIFVLVFTITVIFSAFQLRVNFAEPKVNASGETVTLSLPINISNYGFYDISNWNLTTRVKGDRGIPILDSSTFVPLISRGENTTVTHNISLILSDILSKGLANMLFNDSTLNVDFSLKIEYARVIPLQIQSNFSIPWGAPLYNLSLGNPIVEDTNIIIPVSFENHSFFALNGTVALELFDDSNYRVGNGTAILYNVQPQSYYSIEVPVSFLGDPRLIKEARIYFYTSIFSYGPVVFRIV